MLNELTIHEAHQKIQDGAITSFDLTRACLDRIKRVDDKVKAFLTVTEKEIYDIAGETFNINSPKQLGGILFDKIGLKPIKKTKTGPSTSLDVLETLALQHDLPRKILDYRSIFKLKSTYVDSLSELVNPKTGRIHTSYNQAVAVGEPVDSTGEIVEVANAAPA